MSGIGSRIFFPGERACRRHGAGQSAFRRRGSLSLSDGHSLARFAGAFWFLEKHAAALQPMVQERRFRSCAEPLGQRRRIRNDRRHDHPRPSTQRRGAKKRGEDQAIGTLPGRFDKQNPCACRRLGQSGQTYCDGRSRPRCSRCGATARRRRLRRAAGRQRLRCRRTDRTAARRENRRRHSAKEQSQRQRECDFILYKERNLIERLFGKLKQFRAIATTLRQACEKLPRRNPPRCRCHPAQLRTGPRAVKISLTLYSLRRGIESGLLATLSERRDRQKRNYARYP